MNALIYVDLEAVLPVVDDVWHRVDLTAFPDAGQGITMLCGLTAAVEYERLEERRKRPLTQCWDCDLVYRRRKGIAIPPGHPGRRRTPPSPPQQRGKR